jgi:integrase
MTTIKKSLFKTPKSAGVNSVLSPCTQSASLCELDNNQLSALNACLYFIYSNPKAATLERVLVDLMLSGGLRISEVLNPAGFKVNMLGQVYVIGSKGSENKLVTPLFMREWWLANKCNGFNPFFNYSRFAVHRMFVRNGIFLCGSSGYKNKTTHSLRHLNVALMQLMELPKEELSRLIGHKSFSAINYYLSGKNQKYTSN